MHTNKPAIKHETVSNSMKLNLYLKVENTNANDTENYR